MAVENPTAANVSLWARFFRDEWGIDRTPANSYLSRAAAAAVSSWLTVLLAPGIGRLYSENAPYVSGFGVTSAPPAPVAEPPVPPELRREGAPRREATQSPDRRRRYERRSSSRPGTSSASTTRSEMATISH